MLVELCISCGLSYHFGRCYRVISCYATYPPAKSEDWVDVCMRIV